ncbi:hypothetical protein BDW22DRAFT_1134775 [Trametopsis cervina]|nr:hypothetical protein BDW22DRAFT_1134775 [Trametopsis cervina]
MVPSCVYLPRVIARMNGAAGDTPPPFPTRSTPCTAHYASSRAVCSDVASCRRDSTQLFSIELDRTAEGSSAGAKHMPRSKSPEHCLGPARAASASFSWDFRTPDAIARPAPTHVQLLSAASSDGHRARSYPFLFQRTGYGNIARSPVGTGITALPGIRPSSSKFVRSVVKAKLPRGRSAGAVARAGHSPLMEMRNVKCAR